LRGRESAVARICEYFVDLGLNLVQVCFQGLCVLKLAVSVGFLDKGLQKGFLLEKGLKGVRKLRVWIDDRDIGRCSLWGCRF
jgi:hypothetical protein